MRRSSISILVIVLLLTTISTSVAQDANHELVFWESIQNSTSIAEYRAYVDRFPDGVFVPLALNRIHELGGPGQEDMLELTRDERRQIQSGLLVVGFSPGRIHGLFGQLTRTAIRAWQRSEGLDESGYLDAESAAKLLALGETSDEEHVKQDARLMMEHYNVTRISASVAHTCALRSDGTAACWPDILDAARPPGTQEFISISTGGTHTCALRADGQVICWGDNEFGQATPPSDEPLLTISSGADHTCGLREDGRPVCWGNDDVGQTSPPSSERLINISSGIGHTCGLRADGTVVCWGADDWQWSHTEESLTSIESAHLYRCGLREDGVALCWSILDGEQKPLVVDEHLVLISAGYGHACGLRADGTAVCWELGEFEQDGQANPPPSERFVSISSGAFHTCGMRDDNSVMCWGLDAVRDPPDVSIMGTVLVDDHADVARSATELTTPREGQIDSSNDVDYFVFSIDTKSEVAIFTTGDVDTIGSLEPANTRGYYEPLVSDDDGGDFLNFRIWAVLEPGEYYVRIHSFGEETGDYSIHLEVTLPLRLTFAVGEQLSAGWSHTCGLRPDGSAVCWGSNYDGEAIPPADEYFSKISSGSAFTCGLRRDGSAQCWGNNDYGQLNPPDAERFAAISSGYSHVCGLRVDGTVVCWGRNDYAQASPPTEGYFVALSSRKSHTCGLLEDGSVVCWGRNDDSQATPPSDERFIAVDTGLGYTCGLHRGGRAECWGNLPGAGFADFITGEEFIEVSSGWHFVCGLVANGAVRCWIREEYDLVVPSGEFATISGRAGHMCGLRHDGSVQCWGDNEHGQVRSPEGERFAVEQIAAHSVSTTSIAHVSGVSDRREGFFGAGR